MGMDFRKELGHPFQAPFQATAARYTDNYVLMISGSKIFSYAGQRIAIAAISDKLRNRFYPALKERYGIGRFAESYALTFLYAASSGASHSAQYALAAMFKAAADGKLDFVGHTREYAHRAHRVKELFERHGFHIVYDKDQDEHVSDGFFFTVGYGSMPSSDLVAALLRYGICAISLTSTGSLQNGVRVCVSQMNREEQYDLLDRRSATSRRTTPGNKSGIAAPGRCEIVPELHSGEKNPARTSGNDHSHPTKRRSRINSAPSNNQQKRQNLPSPADDGTEFSFHRPTAGNDLEKQTHDQLHHCR
mgnify:CR=1 FL=1